MSTLEGCASVCDSNGRLLFYTDGTDVWNRNHELMLNGRDLPRVGTKVTNSTAQGAIIVPMPGKPLNYYVFSLSEVGSDGIEGNWSFLWYSIVDMNLDNGLGGVISDQKGIQLDSLLTEHMTAVSGNNCNIWLLVNTRANTLKSYNIDFNGIDPNPNISPIVPRLRSIWWPYGSGGNMEITPNGDKLAIGQGRELVLYDLDSDRGKVSNPVILDHDSSDYYYGVCFSPDNTKLYATTKEYLYQFDLSSNDPAIIPTSKQKIAHQYGHFFGIKRGSDGRIYCTGNGVSSTVNIIYQPNLVGTACNYQAYSFSLLPGTSAPTGLPNVTTIVTQRTFHHSYADTLFCTDSFVLKTSNPSGSHYQWKDGSKDTTLTIYNSGVYWVSYQVKSPCITDYYVDTFNVIFDRSPKEIYTTTISSKNCKSDSTVITASNSNGVNCLWEDGSSGKQRKINKTGIYWVSYRIDSVCEHYIDSFIVTYPDQDYQVSFTVDTLVCENDLLEFQNTSDPHYNSFIWSFGNGDSSLFKEPQYAYTQAGNYKAELIGKIDDICPDTVYKTITVDPLVFSNFISEPDSICVGEGITFSHETKGNTINSLQWQFGDGMELSSKDNRVKHAYDIAGTMPVTFSAQFRACPDTSYTDTVYIFDLPKVDLGADSSICLNGMPIYLKNQQPEAEGLFHYLWNTGAETETLKVTRPGTYSLTVSSDPVGCSSTESIKVTKNCYMGIPNAFTPNGDGANDYFFPRQLLSKSVTDFKMQIFNRWGQLLFESKHINGRGWDGKFNGSDQPGGVYIYRITVTFGEGNEERYEGNVTLIR